MIEATNHLDLHGNKLLYKRRKMLPAAVRKRSEREKRGRRGHLEEQHRHNFGLGYNCPTFICGRFRADLKAMVTQPEELENLTEEELDPESS